MGYPNDDFSHHGAAALRCSALVTLTYSAVVKLSYLFFPTEEARLGGFLTFFSKELFHIPRNSGNQS